MNTNLDHLEAVPFSLVTARLIVRPLIWNDLAVIHNLLNEAFDPLELAVREDWLRWSILNYKVLHDLHQPPYGDYAIVLKENQTVIGSVGFVPAYGPFQQLSHRMRASTPTPTLFSTEMGLFWALGKAYRGHGYCTEAARAMVNYAFTTLKLARIVATTEYNNIASQAVMRRLGMILEHNPLTMPAWFQMVGILENPSSHP